MTIPDSKPLNLRDTIYCTSVSLTAIAMVLCGVLRRMIGWVGVLDYLTPLLAMTLAMMSPAGIILQIVSRRLFRPRDVVICVVITTVWAAMLITAIVMTRGD